MKKKNLNYFDNFVKNSNYALQACQILKDFVYNFDKTQSKEIEEAVHKLEHEADENKHEIVNYLIKDFLPPIDREDIVLILHRIDDVVDNVDEFVINLNVLDVEQLRDDVVEFIDLLGTCLESLSKLLVLFENLKKYNEIKEYIININKIEEDGDKLYQNALKRLYKTENNAIEVIKWTTLYNCLETCIDSCESVADCVEEILMKNS